MRYNIRCICCNKVSNQEIETDVGDFSSGEFVPDPVDQNNFICIECKEWHEELMLDYEYADDPWGLEDNGFMDVFALELETIEPANDND